MAITAFPLFYYKQLVLKGFLKPSLGYTDLYIKWRLKFEDKVTSLVQGLLHQINSHVRLNRATIANVPVQLRKLNQNLPMHV